MLWHHHYRNRVRFKTRLLRSFYCRLLRSHSMANARLFLSNMPEIMELDEFLTVK